MKKNVIHFITDLDTGGAEMMLYKLVHEMDRDKYSSIIVSLKEGGQFSNRIQKDGIPVFSLGVSLRNFTRAISIIKHIVSEPRSAIIQGWMYHGNLAAVLGSILAPRTPVIWNVRQSLYSLKDEKLTTNLVIRSEKLVSGLPKRIVYNSVTSAKHHEAIGFSSFKTTIIPNGFDVDVFTPSATKRRSFRNAHNLSDSDTLIGIVARYHHVKGYDVFLRAASILVRHVSNVRFVMVGHGVDENNLYLRGLIRDLGLGKQCLMLGENSNVEHILPAIDIVTSSSRAEAFSNTIGEAMSCGIPCVVTDVGDSASIVGETGLVVGPEDVDGLVRAWRILSLNVAKRHEMGKMARQRVMSSFSIKSITKMYESLYDEMTSPENLI